MSALSAPHENANVEKLLNRQMTLERFAGDEELLGDIANVFIKTVPQLVATLETALKGNDMKTAFHQAHSLKGAVAAFEAPRVLVAIKEVEQYSKNNDTSSAKTAFPAAQLLVAGMLSELAEIVEARTNG